MPYYDDDSFREGMRLPQSVLCLKVPGKNGEELVVHRDEATGEDYVFLFEALDDAADYARAAEEALGYPPEIGRVRLRDLPFRTARFKPADANHVDLPLRHIRS